MPAVTSQILQNIVETLRAGELFELVAFGDTGSDTAVPRCQVHLNGIETFQSDSSSRCGRLTARIAIHCRGGENLQTLQRLSELCNAAAELLLEDTSRGSLCVDLPAGMATEIGKVRVEEHVKRPEIQAAFEVHCCFIVPDEGLTASSLGGRDLFGSGLHTILPGSRQRQITRRGFSGLDGELALDMGMRSRLIFQTGRLQASTASGLNTLICDIEALIDGKTRTLIDGYGNSYPNVMVEEFKLTGPVKHGSGFFCDYEIKYRQLP